MNFSYVFFVCLLLVLMKLRTQGQYRSRLISFDLRSVYEKYHVLERNLMTQKINLGLIDNTFRKENESSTIL